MYTVYGLITIVVCVVTTIYSLKYYSDSYMKGLLINLFIIVLTALFFAYVMSGTRFLTVSPLFHINIAYFLRRKYN